MSEGRIFVDDEPPTGPGPAAWLVVVLTAVILAAASFVLSGRGPAEDQALVRLPAPSSSTTSTAAELTTTTSLEPDLVLQAWVPDFDRNLTLVTVDERGLAVTTWETGLSPTAIWHDIGTVHHVSFDADGTMISAVTSTSSGQAVVWIGHASALEPAMIGNETLTAAFHDSIPARLATSSTADGSTRIDTYAVAAGGPFELLDSYELAGNLRVRAWTTSGMLLTQLRDRPVIWLTDDGTVEEIDGRLPAYYGAPLIYLGDGAPPPVVTLTEGAISDLPEATRSLSPGQRYAIVLETFPAFIIDRTNDTASPIALGDTPTLPADWSGDERWLVSLSAFETARGGHPITRLVFIDSLNGSTVSVWLEHDQIARPHFLAISD